MIPAKDREAVFKVGLNVKMLWELCQAIGCETAQLEFANAEDGIIVKPTSVNSRNTMHPSKPAANELSLRRDYANSPCLIGSQPFRKRRVVDRLGGKGTQMKPTKPKNDSNHRRWTVRMGTT